VVTDLTIELQPSPAAPIEARRVIGGCLSDSLPAPLIHDLRVVATELIANAVDHGPGEPIRMRIALADDGSVHGEVDDGGTGEIAPGAGGIGLWIVDALADSWAPRRSAEPVRFELAGR
jgi:anti-sigma regulatory factor (Ser/Thr protein kinase)